MFAKILIANRGEIACRVIDTCRRLGVATVAVYSDVDADARHVHMADEAVALGGTLPAESYLCGDAIIAAAKATGAEAIHPGYGFLSENPDFVKAVGDAGLVFIGPSADAIRAMGLKDAAKALMETAGVPVVPGYHGADQTGLATKAAEIGYPVLIKAVAGGGGKGMRLVEDAADFEAALASAQSEAQSAFGNPAVLIEKYIQSPRHIEVQVFGDGTRAVHLFERDCSLQRRHQKVIEEAPAPGMTDDVRTAMGTAAVKAAEAIGYAGAGTVEFIVDGSDGLRPEGFWFMEMNTRLQVEHPVTEAITGVDLVEWQLRVASGQPLPMAQDDLSITGHAFEARLYAEDVAAGFLPATGTLDHLKFPDTARVDTGVRAGDVISPFYDPMIAKLTVHGATRTEALRALHKALSLTEVAGSVTNLAFLRKLSAHDGFAAGDVDTGLIARDLETLAAPPVPCARAKSLAALGALGLDHDVPDGAGFALWTPQPQRAMLIFDGETIAVDVTTHAPGRFTCQIGDEAVQITGQADAWVVNNAKTPARIRRIGQRVSVFWGNNYHFDIPDPLARGEDDAGSGNAIKAPMPGLVKAIHVTAGAAVAKGDPLAVLEAMKMEHVMTAARDGRIAETPVRAGDQVEAGAVLILLEDAE